MSGKKLRNACLLSEHVKIAVFTDLIAQHDVYGMLALALLKPD
jgi:hypothetical protein